MLWVIQSRVAERLIGKVLEFRPNGRLGDNAGIAMHLDNPVDFGALLFR